MGCAQVDHVLILDGVIKADRSSALLRVLGVVCGSMRCGEEGQSAFAKSPVRWPVRFPFVLRGVVFPVCVGVPRIWASVVSQVHM